MRPAAIPMPASMEEGPGYPGWLAKLVRQLRPWANQMAARFGAPVYLAGSACRLEKPRDIDIRIELTEGEFVARYGEPSKWSRDLWQLSEDDGARLYLMDMMHLSREASLMLRCNIDFAVQPPYIADLYTGRHRLRLDDLDHTTDLDKAFAFLEANAPRLRGADHRHRQGDDWVIHDKDHNVMAIVPNDVVEAVSTLPDEGVEVGRRADGVK